MSVIYCHQCGAPGSPSAQFCTHCGAARAAGHPSYALPRERPRSTAWLPILLGVGALLFVGLLATVAVVAPRMAERVAAIEAEMLPPPAALPDAGGVPQHGARAVGAEGAWGVAWDALTPEAAQERALAECSPGRDCRVVLFVAGPVCGAVAAGRSTFGNGLAPTRKQAERFAMEACGRDGARSCSVRVWGCNARS